MNPILDQLKLEERSIIAQLLNKKPPADPEIWRQVVEDALTIGGPKKKIFLQVRQEAAAATKHVKKKRGRPGWLAYVQRRYAEELAKLYGGPEDKYWINERNLQKMWNELVNLVIRINYIMELNRFKEEKYGY